MWQQTIFYQGNSSGLFQYDAFVGFMKGKGLHLPYENTPLRKTEQYVIEPATTLTYRTWKRVVPRGMDLWEVRVTLSGYGVAEVEEKLHSFFTIECFE